jgi:hypothetical protein
MPTWARSFGRSVLRVADGNAVDEDLALLERLEAVHALDERRLARAGGAADDDDLALLDLGGAVRQHLELPYHLLTFFISIMGTCGLLFNG